ncbi:NADH dehydrogenase [ubiquinone] 1 alpha subcomplex subunit 6 [Diachasma alloeum]|uniref:NADH dehydrogenase [ubiquinone] 1 alpha subcomplex subunit 6 n=1 Tax=Diachasma alloeum TaxID=454923 RepID=A0A4E0S110_9HYME|nr:NADH dehydrogenase [ubiquinone] 1 alpha subcomplex subunit 6 [Diachasma alloeum]THK33000.1 B14 subunit, NADH-dehydrogenase [Diachasma alloeum]
MATPAKAAVRQVQPLLSRNNKEAHRRVINLYRAWYRQIPYINLEFDIPKTENDMRQKLREEFMKHKDVKDIRIIDLLVVKGQMELQETAQKWKNSGTFMYLYKDTVEKKPTDFMSKFLAGQD